MKLISGEELKIGQIVAIGDDGKVYACSPSPKNPPVFTAPVKLKKGDIVEFYPSNGKVLSVHRAGEKIYEPPEP